MRLKHRFISLLMILKQICFQIRLRTVQQLSELDKISWSPTYEKLLWLCDGDVKKCPKEGIKRKKYGTNNRAQWPLPDGNCGRGRFDNLTSIE